MQNHFIIIMLHQHEVMRHIPEYPQPRAQPIISPPNHHMKRNLLLFLLFGFMFL